MIDKTLRVFATLLLICALLSMVGGFGDQSVAMRVAIMSMGALHLVRA